MTSLKASVEGIVFETLQSYQRFVCLLVVAVCFLVIVCLSFQEKKKIVKTALQSRKYYKKVTI